MQMWITDPSGYDLWDVDVDVEMEWPGQIPASRKGGGISMALSGLSFQERSNSSPPMCGRCWSGQSQKEFAT